MKRERNANGNAEPILRPDGRWEARCIINGKMRSFYGKTQKEALEKRRSAQKMQDDGISFEPKKATMSQWLDEWLELYAKPKIKLSSYETYVSRIETHIKPNIGKIKLTTINSTQIQAFYNYLHSTKNLNPKTIKNVHGILHKALHQAIKLRYIGFNPCDACDLPRIEKKEITPLSDKEVGMFIQAIDEGEPLKDLFTFALFTGMREGEVCGLSWKDVNFKNNTITVRQQLCKEKKKGGKFYIATTKNSKIRTLTVAPFVMELLHKVKKEQMKNHMLVGLDWQNEFDVVFTNELGKHIVPQTAYKRFKRVATKVGRPDARFHDLRHTFAVISIQEGDDMKTVQNNLGHTTIVTTLDVYGHVSEKTTNESAMRKQNYFEKIRA